ncbi:MAG: Uma2 family endonuclease [Gemmatimonadaceae bacterium]
MSIATLMSAHDLSTYDAAGQRTELVEGQLVVREPTGLAHGRLAAELAAHLRAYAYAVGAEPMGVVLAGDPGFWIARAPDTVRAPDVAFVRRERWPTTGLEQYGTVAPDLVIEIRSPTDRTGALLQKVSQWLTAGTAIVWVIDPARRTAQHFAADGTIALLGANETLLGAPVLDGLQIPLAPLWSPPW